jgi:hypothetical protein
MAGAARVPGRNPSHAASRVAERVSTLIACPVRLTNQEDIVMKKIAAMIVASALVSLLSSTALAAETKSGTIKKVDAAARTITFRQDRADKDEVLKVDQAVDLKAVKAEAKAEVTVDDGVVKGIKAQRPSAGGY